MKTTRCWVSTIFSGLLFVSPLLAQYPNYTTVSEEWRDATFIAIASSGGKALVFDNANATPENIALLANVQQICVLPFDGWESKSVRDKLPSFEPAKTALKGDVALRRLRNEVSEELVKYGFQVVDCTKPETASSDAEVVFAKVTGGGIVPDMNSLYWHLYAPGWSVIRRHGELDLLNLAIPAPGHFPLDATSLAEQIRAVVTVAKLARSRAPIPRSLADVGTMCVRAPELKDVRQRATLWLSSKGYQLFDCEADHLHDYDADLSITVIPGYSYTFTVTPHTRVSSLFRVETADLETGLKALDKAIRKAKPKR